MKILKFILINLILSYFIKIQSSETSLDQLINTFKYIKINFKNLKIDEQNNILFAIEQISFELNRINTYVQNCILNSSRQFKIKQFLKKYPNLYQIVKKYIILNQKLKMEIKYLKEIDYYVYDNSYGSEEQFEKIRKAEKETHKKQMEIFQKELEVLKQKNIQLTEIESLFLN